MMTIPTIPYLPVLTTENAGEILPKEGLALQLQQINWQEFPHKPEVDVYLGHSGDSLFLHYKVGHDYVRAVNRKDQEPVYEDSCVEFFLQENRIADNCQAGIGGGDRNGRRAVTVRSSCLPCWLATKKSVPEGGTILL
ncbi:MAG: carbohydrate-binding family 9-like protein [Desulfuromonadales bacterium]